MNREEKQQEIERLRAELSKAVSVFLMNFEKIPVQEDWELRRQIRAAGGRYRVLKNTLAEIGGKGTPAEALMRSLSGPTAMATTETNPVALAKALSAYAKANPNFTFRAGWVEGRVISIDEIAALVQLPGKEELLAKVMFLINSPARGVAAAAQMVIGGLARALHQAVQEGKLQQ
ncbi:MAG TPA: 50S ribosomal protein L10 [Terriglobia bacterium]|nr:50S ribosomal protein L10 [Terriglobia bacterium]